MYDVSNRFNVYESSRWDQIANLISTVGFVNRINKHAYLAVQLLLIIRIFHEFTKSRIFHAVQSIEFNMHTTHCMINFGTSKINLVLDNDKFCKILHAIAYG